MAFADWIFGNLGALIIIGCASLAMLQLLRVAVAVSARYWRIVPGTIERLDYREIHDDNRIVARIPRVSYRYEFAGRAFTGRRVWLAPRMFTNYSRMVESLRTILPGDQHPVRVFAPLPRLAVLLPGVCAADVFCLVFLVGTTSWIAWWLR